MIESKIRLGGGVVVEGWILVWMVKLKRVTESCFRELAVTNQKVEDAEKCSKMEGRQVCR